MSWYDVLKDFAGPGATVLASGAAAYITWKFASRQLENAKNQTKIADQQRHIAEEQKYIAATRINIDLSEKRLVVFEAVRELIGTILQEGGQFGPNEISTYNFKTANTVFLFEDNVVVYVHDLRRRALQLQYVAMKVLGSDANRGRVEKVVEEQLALESAFADELPRAIEMFRPYLRFRNFNPESALIGQADHTSPPALS